MSSDENLTSLFKGSSLNFIFGLFGFVVMFLFNIFAARYFGSSDFGSYQLLLTIFGIALAVSTLGIPEGILVFLPSYIKNKDHSKLNGYLKFIYLVPFSFALVISILIFFFSNYLVLLFHLPSNFVLLLKLVALILPIKILSFVTRYLFIVKKLFFYQNISYNIIERLILLFGLFAIIFFNLKIFILGIIFIGSLLLSSIFDFIIFKLKVFFTNSSFKSYETKSWLKFSLPLFLVGVFAYLISWSDNLAIGILLSSSAVGIYSVTYSFASFLLFFQGSFSSVFLSLISGKKDSLLFLFKKARIWIFLFSFPLFILMVSFSYDLLNLLYGSDYVSGYYSLIILASSFQLSLFFGLNRAVLLSKKKSSYLFLVTIVIAILNLIINFILIPVFGILGAALASGLSMLIQEAMFYFKARTYEKIPFLSKSLFKIVFSGSISLGVLLLLKMIFFNNFFIKLIFLSFSFILVYLGFLIIFKVFDEYDFKLIDLVGSRFKLNKFTDLLIFILKGFK